MAPSPKKRRKFNYADNIDSGQSLSAFAARRSLAVVTESNIQIPDNPAQDGENSSSTSVSHSLKASQSISLFVEEEAHDVEVQASDEQDPSSSSREESPEIQLEQPSLALSTFRANITNAVEEADGSVTLILAPGERLIVIGEYEISVQEGCITFLGAALVPSQTVHRVYAPSSHSLPVIRCAATEVDNAKIRLHQTHSGLGTLKSLSPLFGKMFENYKMPLGNVYEYLRPKSRRRQTSSFQTILFSQDIPDKTYLQPLISPPEWNQLVAKVSTSDYPDVPYTIMICGPKASGKSTLAKVLTNRLLSERISWSRLNNQKLPGVAVLDLDPGQPEYSTPGQLSLVHIHEYNFGPPFSHPTIGPKSRVICAHTIGDTTPAQNVDLYMACALSLYAQYQTLQASYPGCPLIINTCGWVLGTGLEILVNLITNIRPSDVIYMSQEGPWEVTESLKEATKDKRFYTLPSQMSEYTTRTAAHLRAMQAMSYFHLDPTIKDSLAWSGQLLTTVPPWEISYSAENSAILGILCYGEQPPADLLLESINGSLVAVIVLDDMTAIPGWDSAADDDVDQMDEDDIFPRKSDGDDMDQETPELQRPLIVRTPTSDIPYFNPLNSISLSPTRSHCVGLALVRGVDIKHKRLQVITPISSDVIEDVSSQRKPIVLISGKFDTPGWAYTEETMSKSSAEEDDAEETNLKPVGDVPWVERLEGSEGRGVGARVWRVRRDLGRSEGGD